MGPELRAYERYISGSDRMETAVGTLTLRRVVATDLPILMAWRADAQIIQYMPTAQMDTVDWKHEVEWYTKNIGLPGHHYWVATVRFSLEWGPRPIGMTHFNDRTGEVGLFIGEKSLWNKGVGKAALQLTLRKITESRPSLVTEDVLAMISPENEASIRLFESLGFIPGSRPGDEEGRNGQIVYRWNAG